MCRIVPFRLKDRGIHPEHSAQNGQKRAETSRNNSSEHSGIPFKTGSNRAEGDTNGQKQHPTVKRVVRAGLSASLLVYRGSGQNKAGINVKNGHKNEQKVRKKGRLSAPRYGLFSQRTGIVRASLCHILSQTSGIERASLCLILPNLRDRTRLVMPIFLLTLRDRTRLVVPVSHTQRCTQGVTGRCIPGGVPRVYTR